MCSCCCLLFPITVLASQHGDFGIAAELRCHGSGLCCRTVYTWDLESLSVVSLSPIYSTFLSGFLWCSRGYQLASLLLHRCSLSLYKLTYIMRHMYLKTKCPNQRLCLIPYLPLSTSLFHFLCSCLHFIPLSIPMWGFKYGNVGYHSPLSPPAYITVYGLLWKTTELLAGLCFKFSSLDLMCDRIDFHNKLKCSECCRSCNHTNTPYTKWSMEDN